MFGLLSIGVLTNPLKMMGHMIGDAFVLKKNGCSGSIEVRHDHGNMGF